MLPSVLPRLGTDSAVRVFPGVWKPLFFRAPSRDRALSLPLLSLFCLLYFFHLLSKIMGCFSGCLMSSAGIQKLFCGIYSAFKCSFDEFVGEKVVSPSYSSAILAPPPLLFNMLSTLVIAFLPRSKRLLISWLPSPSAVILKPKKIKSVTVCIVSPSSFHEVMGLDAMSSVF